MFSANLNSVKMPKKFVGENSKAVAARARKVASKEADNAKKQKEAEDAYWRDENKQILKKAQKKVTEYYDFYVV